MIVGLGSDLCNIERIQASLDRFGERFEARVFTDHERARAARRPFTKAGTLAKRFAAKEAFSKAVGTGFRRGVFMKDIGVVNAPGGAPTLALTGGAKQRLDALIPEGHVAAVHLTLTDDHPWAQAFVIIEAIADPRHEEAVLDGNQTPEAAVTPPPADAAAQKKTTDWWGEVKGIFWLVLIVLGFHSFVAKPFYIPSESMLPGLRIGDRLVVSKFAYGWSFVSPTIPNPVAIFKSVVLRQPEESWSVGLPFVHGRLFGSLPTRGDVVIVTPPGTRNDYIKRVIGLPGDTLSVQGGTVILNGKPIARGEMHYVDLPVDTNSPCSDSEYYGARRPAPGGGYVCHLPIVTETLPNGRHYDTVDLEPDSPGDNFATVKIPANHVFLMGDNRDRSADSRFPLSQLGLGGPVPYENLGGRAEFLTFSLDGDASWNPLTWWGSLRSGRAGLSLHPAQGK